MSTKTYADEIRDINLNYLVLAQQMIREDLPEAVARLGLSHEVAKLIEGLSTLQLISLAGQSSMLTRFRFDDASILGLIANTERDSRMAQMHSAILLASQPVAEIH